MSIHSDSRGIESSEHVLQGEMSVDYWEELVKLEPEEGLRKAGLPDLAVGKILKLAENRNFGLHRENNPPSDFEAAFALAIVGRGESLRRTIDLSEYPRSPLQIIALVCNLSVNTRIQHLLIDGRNFSSFSTLEISRLCRLFENNRTVNFLNMSNISLKDEEALRCLLSGLKKGALEDLVLSFKSPSSVPLAELLSGNPILKSLELRGDWSLCVADVREAVTNNTTLEVLHLQSIAYDDMTVLFESLSVNLQEDTRSSESATNTTLSELRLDGGSSSLSVEDSKVSLAVASLARMIESNRTLDRLYIGNMPFLSKHWIDQIFPALARNPNLSKLFLCDCGGLSGNDVGHALVDTIRESNTNLATVDITKTALRKLQGQVNEELWLGTRRWRRLEECVKLDPEEGLRKAGLTDLVIRKILDFANEDDIWAVGEHYLEADLLSDTENVFLLAIVGRGESQCKKIKLGQDLNSLQTIALVCNLTINTNVKTLEIYPSNLETFQLPHLVTALSRMIESNVSLTELKLVRMRFGSKHWTNQIFPSLSKNETLEVLDLEYSDGLTEGKVEEALMGLIQEGRTRLKIIRLHKTRLEDKEGQFNEQLRINREYGDKLRGERMVTPTSGRIVLCGFEYAGKTTIGNTMKQIVDSQDETEGTLSTREPTVPATTMPSATPTVPTTTVPTTGCYELISWVYKTCMTSFTGHTQLLQVTEQQQQELAERESAERTRGFDIVVLTKDPKRISVWDFAGQREYYVLHDYLFPDARNTHYLYVASCRSKENKPTSKEKLKEDFFFWMRFIASNSKPHQVENRQLPRVQFVLTKKDKLDEDQQKDVKQMANDIVEELEMKFKDKIDLCKTIKFVNAHNSMDVKSLKDVTFEQITEMLKTQKEYEVCKDIRNALSQVTSENLSSPIMDLEVFKQNIWNHYIHKSANLDAETVLAYLNDTGDVIYPKDLKFIVVNPKWFGVGVLGSTIDPIGGHCGSKLRNTNGFVGRTNLKDLLDDAMKKTKISQHIETDLLIQLLKHLEICFEEDPKNQNSKLFFPVVLDNNTKEITAGERKLEWRYMESTASIYFGRRLECKDRTTMMLTPGFFPRLQVHLVNYIRTEGWTAKDFTVDRNLIQFLYNSNEIIVEYSELDSSLDVIVKSSKTYAKALEFVEAELIKKIRNFCSTAQGCQGVILVQAVIRPECIEHLHLCKDRKYDSVEESFLRKQIEKRGNDFVYHWPTKKFCKDYALDLLEGPGTYRIEESPRNTMLMSSREGKKISNATEDLPKFYLSYHDVPETTKWKAKINATPLEPFMLHVYCDHKSPTVEVCRVSDQKGRDINVALTRVGRDIGTLKSITLSLASLVPAVKVDNLINFFFKDGDLPTIDYKTLEDSIKKTREAGIPTPDEAVKVRVKALQELEDYIAYSGSLKKILNLEDKKKFKEDFGVEQVYYSDGKMGFLCQRHLQEARERGELLTNARFSPAMSRVQLVQ